MGVTLELSKKEKETFKSNHLHGVYNTSVIFLNYRNRANKALGLLKVGEVRGYLKVAISLGTE